MTSYGDTSFNQMYFFTEMSLMILDLQMYHFLLLASVENIDRYMFFWHKAFFIAVRMSELQFH